MIHTPPPHVTVPVEAYRTRRARLATSLRRPGNESTATNTFRPSGKRRAGLGAAFIQIKRLKSDERLAAVHALSLFDRHPLHSSTDPRSDPDLVCLDEPRDEERRPALRAPKDCPQGCERERDHEKQTLHAGEDTHVDQRVKPDAAPPSSRCPSARGRD